MYSGCEQRRQRGRSSGWEIFTELKQRGVEHVFFVCADGLSGTEQAISAAFDKGVYQTCVVHLIRNAMKVVS